MQSREAAESAARETLSMDDLFAVLKNDRRRETVRYIARREGATPLADIATHVAERSAGGSGSYRSAYVSLQQSHLPLLVEYGVVEYDPESKLVSKGPQFRPVVEYLAVSRGSGSRGRAVDLAVSALGIAVLVADQLGFVAVGEAVVAAVAVVTLSVLCVLNAVRLLGWTVG